MSNATDYLTGLFDLKPDAPSPGPAAPAPEVPSPEPLAPTVPTAQPQAADHLDHDAQPEALDFGPDGWPVGSIEPEPCPTCPGLLTWQDVGGRWRCETCDSDALARSQRLVDGAARSRQRWPVKHNTTTPGAVPEVVTP